MSGISPQASRDLLSPGDQAPDFELPALVAGVKKRFRLQEQLQKGSVLLAFYPLNWETVSARQLVEYQAERDKLPKYGEVVGVSVDSIMNTTVWEREIGPLEYPLCSDFWPHGEVSQRYGVFREKDAPAGTSERAVFVIDRSSKIVFRKVYGLEEVPPFADALEAMQKH